jgi:hypothetical protein
MGKYLSASLQTLAVIGLLMASAQAQPFPALVTQGDILAGYGDSNGQPIAFMGMSDPVNLECWACGVGCSEDWEETVRIHRLQTSSGNYKESINGPLYTIVYIPPFPCDYFAYGITHFSFTEKWQGKNPFRATVGGYLETDICDGGLLELNYVMNANHVKGPRIECIETE